MASRTRSVAWSFLARDGLDEVLAYIAEDSLEAAEKVLEVVLGVAESLSVFAERGRIVPELRDQSIREVFVYSYRLITEYQLLRLRDHKESREFRTVTGGVLHVKGGATRDLVPFEGNKVASRTFIVTLQGLDPGEFGFLPPGAFTSASSSSSLGKMYSFSVLE